MPPSDSQSPEIRLEVIKQAKPFLLCMSCNAEFPPGSSAECPNCHVSLSVVRRCPGCQRVLGAQHLRCPYCSTAFVPEDQLVPEGASPSPREAPKKLTRREIGTMVGAGVLFAVAIALIVYRVKKMAPKPHLPVGQTYALRETTLYRQPSTSAAPIGELQPGAVVDITDFPFDAVGSRWFEVLSQGVTGFVPAAEVAPPKGKDSENGFFMLRHSLMSLDDPDVMLNQAAAAVDYYEKAFPQSSHVNELRWLLAEGSQSLAGRYARQRTLLERAKEMYTKLAEGNSEFATRARQALEQLPPPGRAGDAPSHSKPARDDTLQLTIVGGSLSPSRSRRATPAAPVRTITVISKTPLVVRVQEAVQLSPELTFQGEIDTDITVHGETAVPKGSTCQLKVVKVPGKRASAVWVTLRLMAVIVDGQTYRVSAAAVRVKSASDSGKNRGSNSQLPSGTLLRFQLGAPLVVTRS